MGGTRRRLKIYLLSNHVNNARHPHADDHGVKFGQKRDISRPAKRKRARQHTGLSNITVNKADWLRGKAKGPHPSANGRAAAELPNVAGTSSNWRRRGRPRSCFAYMPEVQHGAPLMAPPMCRRSVSRRCAKAFGTTTMKIPIPGTSPAHGT